MKIGLYFGTFNPIHIGHLIIANHMAEHSDLDQIWMVVTPYNPHKKKSTLLDDYHRLHMVHLATEDYPKIQPSDIEFKLPQPNYTVNTLAHLQEKFPTHKFSLIMGEDNLRTFHKWRNYEYILEHFHLFVYPRLKEEQETEKNNLADHPHVHYVDAPVMNLSSTLIRNSIKAKKDVRYLLTEPVLKYIDEMNFYK